MHVVYVCNEYPPARSGGIGTAVAAQARGMARAGHEVTVVGLYREPGVERQDGVTVHRLAFPTRSRLFGSSLTQRWRIRSFVAALHRRSAVDVVEWPDYEGLYLAPLRGIADVVRVHGPHLSHSMRGLAPPRKRVERWELRTLRRIESWIGVSDWFTNEWLGISGAVPKRRTTIYNPVDTSVFSPGLAPRVPGRVLYVGGLKRRKGVDVIARAARQFLPRFPQARVVLMGAEADLTRADVLREAGSVADRIDFVPFADQRKVAEAISSAAVYLMPSLYESFGNGWAEAMACGIPVVGSKLSAGPEVVRDGVTGLLADPGEPADVADKVARLLGDPALASRLGAAGPPEVAARFSAEVAVHKAERFYAECVARAATTRSAAPSPR